MVVSGRHTSGYTVGWMRISQTHIKQCTWLRRISGWRWWRYHQLSQGLNLILRKDIIQLIDVNWNIRVTEQNTFCRNIQLFDGLASAAEAHGLQWKLERCATKSSPVLSSVWIERYSSEVMIKMLSSMMIPKKCSHKQDQQQQQS